MSCWLRSAEPVALANTEHPLLGLGIRPLPKRGGVVSNELINQLRDDGGY